MTNLNIDRKNEEQPGQKIAVQDPMRLFRELLSWNPFGRTNLAWSGEEFMPAFEIKETKEAFVFRADLPGVKESDLHVGLSQNRLIISGKREAEKTDKSDTYYTYERSFGSFSRTFALPSGVDSERIKAELTHGVLTVELPKKPEAAPKKVEVKAH